MKGRGWGAHDEGRSVGSTVTWEKEGWEVSDEGRRVRSTVIRRGGWGTLREGRGALAEEDGETLGIRRERRDNTSLGEEEEAHWLLRPARGDLGALLTAQWRFCRELRRDLIATGVSLGQCTQAPSDPCRVPTLGLTARCWTGLCTPAYLEALGYLVTPCLCSLLDFPTQMGLACPLQAWVLTLFQGHCIWEGVPVQLWVRPQTRVSPHPQWILQRVWPVHLGQETGQQAAGAEASQAGQSHTEQSKHLLKGSRENKQGGGRLGPGPMWPLPGAGIPQNTPSG